MKKIVYTALLSALVPVGLVCAGTSLSTTDSKIIHGVLGTTKLAAAVVTGFLALKATSLVRDIDRQDNGLLVSLGFKAPVGGRLNVVRHNSTLTQLFNRLTPFTLYTYLTYKFALSAASSFRKMRGSSSSEEKREQ